MKICQTPVRFPLKRLREASKEQESFEKRWALNRSNLEDKEHKNNRWAHARGACKGCPACRHNRQLEIHNLIEYECQQWAPGFVSFVTLDQAPEWVTWRPERKPGDPPTPEQQKILDRWDEDLVISPDGEPLESQYRQDWRQRIDNGSPAQMTVNMEELRVRIRAMRDYVRYKWKKTIPKIAAFPEYGTRSTKRPHYHVVVFGLPTWMVAEAFDETWVNGKATTLGYDPVNLGTGLGRYLGKDMGKEAHRYEVHALRGLEIPRVIWPRGKGRAIGNGQKDELKAQWLRLYDHCVKHRWHKPGEDMLEWFEQRIRGAYMHESGERQGLRGYPWYNTVSIHGKPQAANKRRWESALEEFQQIAPRPLELQERVKFQKQHLMFLYEQMEDPDSELYSQAYVDLQERRRAHSAKKLEQAQRDHDKRQRDKDAEVEARLRRTSEALGKANSLPDDPMG